MRINRNLKLKDVSNGLGVKMQTVSRWEKMPEKMQVKNLITLVNFYGYDLSDVKIEEQK